MDKTGNLILDRQLARWYELKDHPVQLRLIKAVNEGLRFPLVPAGRRCVHPDTKIWTEQGLMRIADITSPVHVLSWNEKSQKFQLSLSGGSFPKGKENLYRTVMQRGEFVSTGHHQIFSSDGNYQSVSSLSEQQSVQTASAEILRSISECSSLSSLLDVQHYSKIDEDCLRDYADEARQYGLQLLSEEEIDRAFSPLKDGAQEPSLHRDLLRISREDVLSQLLQEHIRHDQLFDRLSSLDFSHQQDVEQGVEAGQISALPLEHTLACLQPEQQFASNLEHRHNTVQHSLVCHSSSLSWLSPNKVLKVEEVEQSLFYDMQVLDTNNYVCEHGIIHHNSGKTERFKRFLVKQANRIEGMYFAAAPTHDQAKKIFWDDLKAFTLSSTHSRQPSESNRIIRMNNGSEIHVIGLDKPQRIEGIPWTGGGIDEFADIKPEAWEANIYPALNTINPTRPDYRAWCWLLGVPDGLNHYYDLCETAKADPGGQFEVFHWMTEEIFPDMAAEARKVMSEKQYNQEFRAAFETASGRIYEDYSDLNYTDDTIQSHEQLHWMHDQNYTPLSSAVGVKRGDNMYLLDEIVLISAVSKQSAMEFVEKYKDHKNKHVLLYGDPAGKAGEKHGHASDYTDIEGVLKANGWKSTRKIRPKHPAIKDRQNAVRAKIKTADGKVSLFVNPKTAKWCHKGLATVQLQKGSTFQEDQTNQYQHITTAIGYCVEIIWPVVRKPAQSPKWG